MNLYSIEKIAFYFAIIFIVFNTNAQNVENAINQSTFNNFANSYNYTHWDKSWKTSGAARSFTNHTSSYALNIDFTNLSINSLIINENPTTKEQGFAALNDVIFPNNFQGDIGYSILQNGNIIHNKSASPTSTGNKDSQMAEFGIWKNTRFVNANFTNSLSVDKHFTGIEFTNWHNRFKITFHLKINTAITNGQLLMTFEMPQEYSQYLNNGNIHAFALPNNKGFSIKAGSLVDSLFVNGNIISIYSEQQNLLVGESYEISLLFQAYKEDLSANYMNAFANESEIAITGTQTSPNNSNLTDDVTYNSNEGIHFINVPRVNMGYFNCSLIDLQQSIDFELTNNTNDEKRVKLCFRRTPNINVTGFNSILCNENGDPSGLPLQISKNWHNSTPQLFSGSWIKEYTEILLAPNTSLKFVYKSTGAKWGETYSASSHQLSVAGAGVPRGSWLEAALGTFGESITHSPDYEYGNTNGADIRPFLVTNQAYGGTSSQCGWTGNVGGVDMWVYKNLNNTRIYQSQVQTDFKKYSPNLTETSISAVSSDNKLKLDYTFYLNRSDDFNRIYYKVKIKALDNVSFNRFDIFQLGGDIYNIHNAQNVVYGNDSGLVSTLIPTNNGSNDYTTNEIPLIGTNPWVWAGDGLYYSGANSGINIDTNNGMIIRSYSATFNGIQNNIPYLRERSSSIGFSASQGTNPTSYCLVPPAGVTSFSTGDEINLLVEVVILPKQAVDYYGPNLNFANALDSLGNSHELLYRESFGNKITATSSTNVVDTNYPLNVETINNEGFVEITGGRGYFTLVFSELTNVDNPTLWMARDSCWEIVDQAVHGKDFWQSNYNPSTQLFDLIYNVNQDFPNDSLGVTQYYLGNNPPLPTAIIDSLNDTDSDGIPNDCDLCEGFDDYVDSDNDLIPDGCDICPNLNNNLFGTTCDDGNPCTETSIYINCNCEPITNFALSGVPSMSSSLFSIDNLNDGVINDQNIDLAHTNGLSSNDWMEIDLGAIQSITTAVIWNRTNCCSDRLSNAYLLVSDTPFPSDTNLNSALANADFTFQIGDAAAIVTLSIDVNITGRYVRIQNTDNAINIKELQIFGLDEGIFDDADNDGVCDLADLCNGFDDNIDSDNDLIPDGCDNCPAQLVELGNYNISTNTYFVSDSILHNGFILNTNQVIFKAGNFIELQTTFEVETGASFEAIIEPCNQ